MMKNTNKKLNMICPDCGNDTWLVTLPVTEKWLVGKDGTMLRMVKKKFEHKVSADDAFICSKCGYVYGNPSKEELESDEVSCEMMLDDQAMHDLEQSWVPAIQGKIEKDEIDEDYMEIARFHYKGYNYYLVASLFPHLDEDSAYVTYSIETDRMNPILEGDQDTDLFRNDIADIPDDIRTVDDLAECFRKQAEIEKRSLPDTIDEYVKNGRII